MDITHEEKGTPEGRQEGLVRASARRPGMDAGEWVAWWNSLSPEERVRRAAMDRAYRSSRRVEDILDDMLDRLDEIDCRRDRCAA